MNIEQALQKVLGFGVKEFIEKAIAGKWVDSYPVEIATNMIDTAVLHPTWILLQPEAWKAVGKTEEWAGWNGNFQSKPWLRRMHRLIDALAEQN